MDEIKERLQTTSENCFKSYEVWRSDEKNTGAREALQEAVHELRKVASRVEIELAISERDQMTQRPIPIPPHRDGNARPRDHYEDDGDDDGQGNSMHQSQPQNNHRREQRSGQGQGPGQGGRRRLSTGGPRKPAEGGGQGQSQG